MKISELIVELEKAKEELGDLPIAVNDALPIDSMAFESYLRPAVSVFITVLNHTETVVVIS